jgi:hypothetical protein
MVSAVQKLENDGVKMVEIPAGDYVPVAKPLAAPIITSFSNGRNGGRPRLEMSQEPLIDDIDEAMNNKRERSIMDAFINRETDALFTAKAQSNGDAPEIEESAHNGENGKENIDFSPKPLPDEVKNSMLLDFASLSELGSLAEELINMNPPLPATKPPQEAVSSATKSGTNEHLRHLFSESHNLDDYPSDSDS